MKLAWCSTDPAFISFTGSLFDCTQRNIVPNLQKHYKKMMSPLAVLAGTLLLALVAPLECFVVKRSDDVSIQSLETLVQQQAATIQTLLADMASVKNTVSHVEGEVSSLQSDVTSINTRLQKRVAFTAYMTKRGGVNVGTNSPIVFDHIITNIGAAYDNNNGIFTAPFSGVYSFHFSMLNDAGSTAGNMGVAISTPHVALCEALVVRERDHSSCFGVVHLAKGDHVTVKKDWGTTHLYGSTYTAFSGVLISPDNA